MKKFTERVQRVSQKAAEIRQTIERVPARVAEIREIGAMATGEVQKLRTELVSSLSTLRAETDDQLVTALREIDGDSETLLEAGFRLRGVDMDLGSVRRLKVHLERVSEVDPAAIRALQDDNADKPALHTLLVALTKAGELAGTIPLDHLRYGAITIEMGLIPSVRVGWRASGPSFAKSLPPALPIATVVPSAPAAAVSPTSFFESRPAASRAVPGAAAPVAGSDSEIPLPTAIPTAQPIRTASTVAGKEWRTGALERFKKMPDLTKRSR
jgi:hypothetical protein